MKPLSLLQEQGVRSCSTIRWLRCPAMPSHGTLSFPRFYQHSVTLLLAESHGIYRFPHPSLDCCHLSPCHLHCAASLFYSREKPSGSPTARSSFPQYFTTLTVNFHLLQPRNSTNLSSQTRSQKQLFHWFPSNRYRNLSFDKVPWKIFTKSG